jgi:microcystin-dependent protein
VAEPFVGEIRIFSFGVVPRGWAQCNGQKLPINSNQALFTLLRNTYGGDGVSTFGLPDLRGRVALQAGQGTGLSRYVLGQADGEDSHTLTLAEGVAHGHAMVGSSNPATDKSPANHFVATSAQDMYVNRPDPKTYTKLSDGTVGMAGGSLPHENRQPLLVVNVCIATTGIFPTHN